MTEGARGGNRSVLITGATGALGSPVIKHFLSEGWDVRTLSRTAPPAGTLAATLPHIAADVTDQPALERALRGVDSVVHMAALLHVVDPPPSLRDEYLRVNVRGTASVMAAARACSVRRVVTVSSISVYGSQPGLLDESTTAAPDTLYGVSKFAAEREVVSATSSTGERIGVVLRLAAVYGPGIKGNYQRLVRALVRRRFVPVGNGANRRTLVFEDDVARAIGIAVVHPSAPGRIFNVTDGEIHTVSEITAAIAGALNRRPPRLSIPIAFARLGIASLGAVCRVFGKTSPITQAALSKYTEDVTVSGQRIQDVLGFEPRWGLMDGWQETIARMKQQGRV
jgi:nucleoside-diphosphate-sugar epimerase